MAAFAVEAAAAATIHLTAFKVPPIAMRPPSR
jgi:hypothetical protein